jgi:hypothetical protein
MPERAPTLPSDTLEATQPTDSLTTDSPQVDTTPGEVFRRAPMSPGDSAALRDLRLWIERHPGLVAPPPTRAVLVRV